MILLEHNNIMGGEESRIQGRRHSQEYLTGKVQENLSDFRLKWSHQANIWELCNYLALNYSNWEITELYLDHDMIAGEVIEVLLKINFEKAPKPLRVLGLSHNDIVCDNLKYFRGAYLNCLLMLYLDHNRIASDGCFYLSKTPLAKLQTLDLSHNLINQNAAGHLSNANLPCLVNLIISDNQLTYKGLTLLEAAQWPSLAFLQAKNNAFQPTKEMQNLKFRTEVKMFRLELQ